MGASKSAVHLGGRCSASKEDVPYQKSTSCKDCHASFFQHPMCAATRASRKGQPEGLAGRANQKGQPEGPTKRASHRAIRAFWKGQPKGPALRVRPLFQKGQPESNKVLLQTNVATERTSQAQG